MPRYAQCFGQAYVWLEEVCGLLRENAAAVLRVSPSRIRHMLFIAFLNPTSKTGHSSGQAGSGWHHCHCELNSCPRRPWESGANHVQPAAEGCALETPALITEPTRSEGRLRLRCSFNFRGKPVGCALFTTNPGVGSKASAGPVPPTTHSLLCKIPQQSPGMRKHRAVRGCSLV